MSVYTYPHCTHHIPFRNEVFPCIANSRRAFAWYFILAIQRHGTHAHVHGKQDVAVGRLLIKNYHNPFNIYMVFIIWYYVAPKTLLCSLTPQMLLSILPRGECTKLRSESMSLWPTSSSCSPPALWTVDGSTKMNGFNWWYIYKSQMLRELIVQCE